MTEAMKEPKVKKPAKPEATAAVDPRPEPGTSTKRMLAAAADRFEEMPDRVSLRVVREADKPPLIDCPHTDARGFSKALPLTFGTTSHAFTNQSLVRLLNITARRGAQASEDEINAGMAFVAATEPENEMEAALALQMLAAHELALDMSARTKHATTIPELQEYSKIATKMARTFNSLMETHMRLKRGGEQVVKYIHVHEGGQAVVAGTINQGGRVNGKQGGQPHANGSPSLPCPNAHGNGVPLPPHAERKMSHARGEEHGRS
jgi:hypothetical protein